MNRIVILLLGLFTENVWAESRQKLIEYEMGFSHSCTRFEALIGHPAILVTSLENLGYQMSYAGDVRIDNPLKISLERKSLLPFKKAILQLTKRAQKTWEYAVELSFMGVELQLVIQAKRLAEKFNIAIYSSDLPSIPGSLARYLNGKLQRFADKTIQDRLCSYWNGLGVNPKGDLDSVLLKLLMESHNLSPKRSPASLETPAQDETLYDQRFLISALALWIVGVIVLLAGLFRIRKSRKRLSS